MRNLNRRQWMSGAAASAAVATAATAEAAGKPPAKSAGPASALPDGPPGSLVALCKSKGLLYGANMDVPWLSDTKLASGIKADCNVVGMANAMNWTRTQNYFNAPLDFSEGERVFAFAKQNGMLCRGHNLVWTDGSVPQWLKAMEGSLSASQMAQIMQNHVRDTMKYWRGRLIQQDVVNEPASGQGLQPTIYYRKLGETYIDLAFQAAVEGDPNCLRVINQDWIELDSSEHNRRRAVFIALLERLKKRNVPIQCVGIEGHLQTKYKFNEKLWRAFCDEVVGMGYKLMITEYDVNDAGSTGGPHQHDADAASLMHDFLAVTLSYPQCIGLISQSYTDHYTWLKPFSAGLGQAPTQPRPSPLDADYQRKPMWDAIVAAIKSAPLRT